MKVFNIIKYVFICFFLFAFNFGFQIKAHCTDLIVRTKGSEASGIYAHFSVLVEGQEIGNAFATSDYKPFTFPISTNPSTIQEVRVVFDNDVVISGMDRNLFVQGIAINDLVIPATREYMTYIDYKGIERDYYGVMPWKGDLIFNIDMGPVICEGDITLSSQEEVDAFNCAEITGSLEISGEDITDLSPLSGLKSIGLGLNIHNNPVLTNLHGLENAVMTDGNLTISENNVLENIDGLTSVNKLRELIIRNNPALLDLDGISSLEGYVQVLHISNNDALQHIDGLSKVTSVGTYGGFMYNSGIYNNNSLQNVDGLQSVRRVDYMFFISGNSMLENIDGLSSLVAVNIHLSIENNPSLENIDGLSSLISSRNITIKNNPQLSNLDGLSSFTGNEDIPSHVVISNNDALPNLDGLSSMRSLDHLTIENNDGLENIDGLSSIRRLAELEIKNNDLLQNLNGLSAFEGRLSVLIIDDNDALQNIDGLSAITGGGGYYASISIRNNNSLLDINGLKSINSFGGSLSITGNNSLKHVDGLSSLTRTDNLNITNNNALENINGLSSLIHVSEGFVIKDNTSLVTCCGIFPLLKEGFAYIKIIENNGSGCTEAEILAGGQCTNKVVLRTKGSPVDEVYPHFRLLANDHVIAEGIVSGEFQDYVFPVQFNPDLIHDFRVEFDNDAYTGDEDRNLYVTEVKIGHRHIHVTNSTTTYIRKNGEIANYWGVMPWNGQLVFQFDNCHDAWLFSQADVDIFTCAEVSGDVVISGPDISDLASLSSLQRIEGGLKIYDNPQLTSLEGLHNLTYVGTRLFIANNQTLPDLDGLRSLAMINGNMYCEWLGYQDVGCWNGGLTIQYNPTLTNLNGLSSLADPGEHITITNNPSLSMCCGILDILSEGMTEYKLIHDNAAGCSTEEEVLSNEDCVQEIVISARGSQAGSIFAHFKVLIDGLDIGNAFTTPDYEAYMFSHAADPDAMQEVRVVFDNDAVISGMDRNLYVKGIEINGTWISAPSEDVTYIKYNGDIVNYYGVMPWKGDLIFDLSGSGSSSTRLNLSGAMDDDSLNNERKTGVLNMVIYPNPAELEYNVELKNAHEGPASIIMHDLSGRSVLVHQFNIEGSFENQTIDVSQLNKGVYILKLTTNDFQRSMGKIVVE